MEATVSLTATEARLIVTALRSACGDADFETRATLMDKISDAALIAFVLTERAR